MPPSARSPQPIKAILVLRDLEIRELASHVGRSKAWIGRVVNGREVPSAELAQAIADYLDLPADQLFSDDPEGVVLSFVKRTTAASGVPERIEDDATAEGIAHLLRGDVG